MSGTQEVLKAAPSFNFFQQIFALSLASNLLTDSKGTTTDLQTKIEQVLPGELSNFVPGWDIAFGPVVWKSNPADATTGADNTWFVAHKPDAVYPDNKVYNTYIVALAGTETLYDWFTEDFEVWSVVDFANWVKSSQLTAPPIAEPNPNDQEGIYISFGTAKGVYVVANTPAPPSTVFPNAPLVQFLSTIPADARIVFTGHSLGSALCSTLGLGVLLSGYLGPPGPFGDLRITTYPTAGPSAGNANFNKLFSSSFPAAADDNHTYDTFNMNIVNTLDVVPQAWCPDNTLEPKQNLDNIPSLYGPPLKSIVLGVAALVADSAVSKIVYRPITANYFTGPAPPIVPPHNAQEFLATDARYEHTTAYFDYIGVTPPTPPTTLLFSEGSGLRRKDDLECILSYPVIGRLAQRTGAAARLAVEDATTPDFTKRGTV